MNLHDYSDLKGGQRYFSDFQNANWDMSLPWYGVGLGIDRKGTAFRSVARFRAVKHIRSLEDDSYSYEIFLMNLDELKDLLSKRN